MKLGDALEEYRLHCFAVPVSRTTWRWYEQKLGVFLAFVRAEGVEQVEGLHVGLVNRFTQHLGCTPSLNGRGVRSSYTVKGYIEVVKNFLSWAVEEDLIPSKTRDRVMLPRVEKKVIKTLSREQFNLLMDATKHEATRTMQLRDRAVLCLLLDTGIRATELCTLKRADLHLGEDPHVLVHGKGNKQREVGPLGVECQRHLRRYLRGHEHELVILNRNGGPLNPGGLDQLLYRLRRWAGPEFFEGIRVSAHTFRHTYAVNYLKAGGDVFTLSLLLGHTSVAVTQNYLKDFKQREARRGGSVLDAL